MSTPAHPPAYTLSFARSQIQLDVVHAFLTTSYWSPGIGRERVQRAIDNSLVVGAYAHDGAQVGFARLVTDYAAFGYLADVFVLPQHRRCGLARAMTRAILDVPEVSELRRIMLATRDAHDVYRTCGFLPVTDCTPLMQILRVNSYLQPPT